MYRVELCRDETAQRDILSYESIRQLYPLDPIVNTFGGITSGYQMDDGIPSSSPIGSPQEDGPWIDWKTAQTTIVEVVDDNIALPTDDHTGEEPEGDVQDSSYFQERDREIYTSRGAGSVFRTGVQQGYEEDQSSSPPSSSPPNLFTSSPVGSDDSVDELDEGPEPKYDELRQEGAATEIQEAEMSNLQPSTSVFRRDDIPEEAYNEMYEDDMEQDELDDEEVNSRAYGDTIGPEAAGIRDEAEMSLDLQPSVGLMVVAEDPAYPSFVGQGGDDTEKDELEDEEDVIEDTTCSREPLERSAPVTNAEGNHRILSEEPEQLRAIAQVTEIESLGIEEIKVFSEATEEEEGLRNVLPPRYADLADQPEYLTPCDKEEVHGQDSDDETTNFLPHIDTSDCVISGPAVHDETVGPLEPSPTSSPAVAELETAKLNCDGIADGILQRGEFLPPDLQDNAERDTRPEASLPEYEEPPILSVEARDTPPDELFHLGHSGDAWDGRNSINNDDGQENVNVRPIPPPNPKRQTLASQKRQHKKLIKPFRSPFVGKPVRAVSSPPPQIMGPRKPEPQAIQRTKEKFEVAPQTMVKHRTVRAAVQFKSPLSVETSSQVIPSIRMTPTIQMLERRVQILRRAVKIQEEDDEGNLETLAKKWREAAREVAWEVWGVVKDRVAEQKDNPWGKFEEEDRGKKRPFDESWGWGDQGEAKVPRLEDEEPSTDHDDVRPVDLEFKLTKSIAEEEHRDTLGTMLRQLGIAPETLGWNDEQETFEDD
ncbi:hypothetical protein EYR40_005521 [Pleurotus pulmonarius]|nr:hypothetical protein EYR40_005521 [Pleurotus pulmonarius]